MRYVSHKDKKAFAKDLKEVYTAPSEECAMGSSYSLKRQMGKEISKRHQKLGSQLE